MDYQAELAAQWAMYGKETAQLEELRNQRKHTDEAIERLERQLDLRRGSIGQTSRLLELAARTPPPAPPVCPKCESTASDEPLATNE